LISYRRPFFELQFDFALEAARLTGLPLDKALLDYTNLYARFGLGRDFDPTNPVWRDYLAGLAAAPDPVGWTHAFYRSRGPDRGPRLDASAGCFGIERISDERVRIHFLNRERAGRSPLADEAMAARLAELRSLFVGQSAALSPSARVAGTSWLYHLAAYRRQFPPAYLASAVDAGPRFRNLPLWGQLVDRNGDLRPDAAAAFKARLAHASSADDLGRCFPLHPLALEAPVAAFLEFHRL